MRVIANAPSKTINATEKDQWVDVVTDNLTEAQKDKFIEATTGGLTEAQKDTIKSNISAGGRVLVSSQSVSGVSNVDFTDLDLTSSGFTHYIIEVFGMTTDSADSLLCRLSADNGVSFRSTSDYRYTNAQNWTVGSQNTSTSFVLIPSNLSSASEYNLKVTLSNIGLSNYTAILSDYSDNAGTGVATGQMFGNSITKNDDNAISMFKPAGTMSGTFNLYGVY